MNSKQTFNIYTLLCILLGILIGFLLSTSMCYSQTYSKSNLSLYLKDPWRSIDTSKYQPKATASTRFAPKTIDSMDFQVTILDYKPNKWFYLRLISLTAPIDILKIHTFYGSKEYNKILSMCETLYGKDTDDYIGTLDEELFILRTDTVCMKQTTLNIGE